MQEQQKVHLLWVSLIHTVVVLGTAAVPEVLQQLPKDRVIAALDAVHGEVVIHGWKTKTGQSVFDRSFDFFSSFLSLTGLKILSPT